jgi:hypothetical protein
MPKQKIIINIFNILNIDKIIKIVALTFLLFSLTASPLIASPCRVDYRDYYFKGIIDLKKYPQFKYGNDEQNLEVKFNIYDNKIFTEYEGDYGWLTSSKVNDGSYDFTTEDNIKLEVASVNGEITGLIIKNTEELENKKKLSLKSDSCEIAGFISKFKLAYHKEEIKLSKNSDYKFFGLGDYNKRENKYFFDSWVLGIFKYRNKLLSSYMTNEGDMKMMNGHSCFEYREANEGSFKENLVSIRNCKASKEKIYLEIEECIVTKYSGKKLN